MATFDLTQSPSTVSLSLQGNTALFASALIQSVQTLDRGGDKWMYTLNFTNVSKAKRASLMGLIASARGQSNRFRVPVHDNPKQGAYGGTPLVNGASQTGNTVVVDGAGSVTDWIKAGDYFSIDVNGEHELKMCTADTSSVGGAITIPFEPPLRASPLNNAAIYVEDGVLPTPIGVFLFASPSNGWSSTPFQTTSELSQMVFSLVEDVFATQ